MPKVRLFHGLPSSFNPAFSQSIMLSKKPNQWPRETISFSLLGKLTDGRICDFFCVLIGRKDMLLMSYVIWQISCQTCSAIGRSVHEILKFINIDRIESGCFKAIKIIYKCFISLKCIFKMSYLRWLSLQNNVFKECLPACMYMYHMSSKARTGSYIP